MRSSQSLSSFLRKQARKWSFLGLGVTLFFAIPCILVSAKVASERQLLTTVKAVAKAFHLMIVDDNIQVAEREIRETLNLEKGESAVFFTPELDAIKLLKNESKRHHCQTPQVFCWSPGFKTVSILYPVYFDGKKDRGLFGYLELTLKPHLDFTLISVLVVLLLIAFLGQVIGLSSALKRSSGLLVDQLSQWAEHLTISPQVQLSPCASVPFSELNSMGKAIQGLYLEIERLKAEAAKEAKSEAQLAIIREISHDLKTPHSLIARYFELHLDTVKTTGAINEAEVKGVYRSLRTMGDLLRDVLVLGPKSSDPGPCDLSFEAKILIKDFQVDLEVLEKGVKLELALEEPKCLARVSRIAAQRIIINLLRNALDAVSKATGWVQLKITQVEDRPALLVRDSGSGIPGEIQSKIFDFDFTTKDSRGTGLGLGIIKKLCAIHGAEIRVRNISASGAEVLVLFQAVEPAAAIALAEEGIYGEV